MLPITIHTKFHSIEGIEWGNPHGAPILAFHGWLDNANSFAPLAKFFPNYRFISIDFPGHGKSSHKPENTVYYFAEYALEVVSIAQALGLEDFILMAHSMGAAVSTLVAGTNLLKIKKLVLIESLGPLTNLSESAPDILSEAIKQILHPRGKKETFFPDMESAVSVRMRAGDMKKESAEILMERGIEKTHKGLKPRRDLRLHYNSFFRYTEEQIVSFCSRIDCKTLLILGDRSGFQIAEKYKHRKDAVKHLTEIILPGGHHLHMDSPEEVSNVIIDFLES
ncbi:alpha/beta hydrolase [Leptospira sp. 2 VSF19]|uniref:Alpha/beta hydrolase n=1 Tax=Leptospira soteropolitanensis TaxID=2950025 RepID=A0AAW5VP61_9LEPT|nr:alpha/beta hydrolase [Leptospira soteropolitanensis]MCW7492721.1 alpha/beta hydrolase [Leptospira soteropolitanensis]MCW7500404.1 alpha/beta hydrolase [Leptospira soteropolitanensis]MCW7522561.1 alpha/beta hydrolase [Leptospira soteropolitanensis]MCW7526417.1 alpha/beta hydrolase [Leptospira soteropolitanensis]MCW7530374.1 alpha/beta hydrolase [Leptospira soteropolitanensis]